MSSDEDEYKAFILTSHSNVNNYVMLVNTKTLEGLTVSREDNDLNIVVSKESVVAISKDIRLSVKFSSNVIAFRAFHSLIPLLRRRGLL